MIELHCPNCLARLKIKNASAFQSASPWVKCPKCGEVFKGSQIDLWSLGHSHGLKLNKPYGGYTRQRASGLDNGEKRSSYGDPGGGESLYSVNLRRRGIRSVIRLVFLGALAVLVMVSAGWAFKTSVKPEAPPAEELAPKRVDYASTLLVGDLKAIKEELKRMGRADEQVDFSGYQSRLYKHFAKLLAKDKCQEVVELRVYSEDTSEGFEMTGDCYDESADPAVIKFAWLGNTVVVEVEGEDEYAEVEMEKPTRARSDRFSGDLALKDEDMTIEGR
jgi:predicted Zn finger-like uncharacterized protein